MFEEPDILYFIDRFDIIRKLGQGTYGKVQLAINKETGQEVRFSVIPWEF